MLIFIFAMNSYSSLEILLFIIMVITIGIIGTQYFLGVNLTATIHDFFNKPEVDIAIVQKSEPPDTPDEPTEPDDTPTLDSSKEQTYHVQGRFDYMNAKAICKAYDGKIANIKQVMDAYDNGAEWCDYGWSADRMVLYPTQYKSWKSYQKLGNKKQCGRPGVNGGYNNNIFQQLGVNCFGVKPKLNGPMPTQVIPQAAVNKRVAYWQSKIPTLTVSPFNYTEWSE
jgi:hypothetical protein